MNIMPTLLIVWGGIALVLLVLLGYRGTLTRNEDDQIHLDDAGKHHEVAQAAILRKLNRIKPYLRVTAGVELLTTVWIVGLFIRSVVQKLS